MPIAPIDDAYAVPHWTPRSTLALAIWCVALPLALTVLVWISSPNYRFADAATNQAHESLGGVQPDGIFENTGQLPKELAEKHVSIAFNRCIDKHRVK